MVCEALAVHGLRLGRGGLNPCFSGIWSVRLSEVAESLLSEVVLILVLVEYGL